uniref:Uncharacterized protein n=1 Tax=Hucho hucho TaxID=62062 RepID=A0A4W5NXI5_9TELE
MKFWTCCRRKMKPLEETRRSGPLQSLVVPCSYAESNSTMVIIHVVFDGEKESEQKSIYGGSSVVNMMEISMRKEEPITWAHLDLPYPTDTHTEGGKVNGKWNA